MRVHWAEYVRRQVWQGTLGSRTQGGGKIWGLKGRGSTQVFVRKGILQLLSFTIYMFENLHPMTGISHPYKEGKTNVFENDNGKKTIQKVYLKHWVNESASALWMHQGGGPVQCILMSIRGDICLSYYRNTSASRNTMEALYLHTHRQIFVGLYHLCLSFLKVKSWRLCPKKTFYTFFHNTQRIFMSKRQVIHLIFSWWADK